VARSRKRVVGPRPAARAPRTGRRSRRRTAASRPSRFGPFAGLVNLAHGLQRAAPMLLAVRCIRRLSARLGRTKPRAARCSTLAPISFSSTPASDSRTHGGGEPVTGGGEPSYEKDSGGPPESSLFRSPSRTGGERKPWRAETTRGAPLAPLPARASTRGWAHRRQAAQWRRPFPASS
jgi:hypothetical protein